MAALLAADIADRMKANVCGVVGYIADDAKNTRQAVAPNCLTTDTPSYDMTTAFSVLSSAPPNAAKDCGVKGAGCTAQQMAAYDLAKWSQTLYYGLPNGIGYVHYDSGATGAGGAVDVWVTWLDPAALSDGIYQDIDNKNTKNCPPGFQSVTPQPRCMYFRVGL